MLRISEMRPQALLTSPFQDLLQGLERCLWGPQAAEGGMPGGVDRGRGYRQLLAVGLGFVVSWWIYVPVHKTQVTLEIEPSPCRVEQSTNAETCGFVAESVKEIEEEKSACRKPTAIRHGPPPSP